MTILWQDQRGAIEVVPHFDDQSSMLSLFFVDRANRYYIGDVDPTEPSQLEHLVSSFMCVHSDAMDVARTVSRCFTGRQSLHEQRITIPNTKIVLLTKIYLSYGSAFAWLGVALPNWERPLLCETIGSDLPALEVLHQRASDVFLTKLENEKVGWLDVGNH